MTSLHSHFVRLFLARVHLFGEAGVSIPEQRQRIAAGVRWLPLQRGVEVQAVEAGGVPGEWLLPRGAPRDSAMLYFHGGGFCLCSVETHRPLAAALAKAGNLPALALDYRLAPEHPFPAALEDCLAAYRWLVSSGVAPGRIIVGGDSAGGNLALALLLSLRDSGEPLPAGAVLLSPVTDLADEFESRHSKAAVDLILRNGPVELIAQYMAGQDQFNPLLSPYRGELHDLPPLLFHVGTDEILLDDSVQFVEKARQAGVDARLVVWPGMWHVFQADPSMPESRQSIRQMGEFMRAIIESQPHP